MTIPCDILAPAGKREEPRMEAKPTRVERDTMGPMEVPADAYYGASTQRAVLNFPISGRPIPRAMVRALGRIKWAAARANVDLGLLDRKVGDAIVRASREVVEGRWDAEFVLDVFQTGSGTSSNMNANEVIANRAAELLGGGRGSRDLVHPNDHVNLGQSSNDVIPTALHLGAALAIRDDLLPGLAALRAALEAKSRETWDVIKTGRTHLQDATPIRLGQELLGYAAQVRRGEERAAAARDELSEVALGGTAVGTGVNTHPEFARRTCRILAEDTGLPVRETTDHFQAQATLDSVLAAAGAVRVVAVSLLKIANDLRLLASGPRTGLGELALPEVQPGSSIMPGKVNPVIAESLIQVCGQVLGNDHALVQAAEWSFFELNTMLPLAGRNLIESIELLGAASANFAEKCVLGMRATERGPEMVERGLAIVTGLAPLVGYDKAAAIAKKAAASGRTVREIAREETKLSEAELDRALDPFRMTEPQP
jgi:fumarate hydratase, class II